MEFRGATYEIALEEAAKYFNTKPEMLNCEVLEKGSSSLFSKKPWRIEASMKHISARPPDGGDGDDGDDRDAAGGAVPLGDITNEDPFRLLKDDDFRIGFDERGVVLYAGKDASAEEITDYAARRQIKGADVRRALEEIRAGRSPAILAPEQQGESPPANDTVRVTLSSDHMAAQMIIYPGDEGGKRLQAVDVVAALRDTHGIVDGLDVEAIHQAIRQGLVRTEITVARGRPAQDGVNGSIEYHFQTSHSHRPKVGENDRVDYRTLDIFDSVKKGDLLVTKNPAQPGIDGATLKGKALKAKPSKEAKMPRGKGVSINAEDTHMYAALDGMVNLIDSQVVVSSLYVVENNVDMSVGNIEFHGDVEIRGNVNANMTIRADGNIEVHGVVEAAKLIAGGNIVLRQGMQGNDKGEVTAGGDVVAKYFERTRVSAKGAITADAILHSELSAAEGITLVGKRASIVGGIARSATFVAAKSIGTVSHTTTIVEVGILPEQRERYNFLGIDIRRLEHEREKLQMLVTSFRQVAKDDTAERAKLRERVMGGYEATLAQLESEMNERDELAAQMASITGGKVHVMGTIHPGTRIVIGSEVYVVESPIDYATFRLAGGAVRFFPCELG